MKRKALKYILSLLMILSVAIFVPSCSTDSDSSETQTEKPEDKEKDKDKEKDNPENPDTPENPDLPDNPGEKENPEEPDPKNEPEIPQEIPLRAIEVVRFPTKTSYDVTLDESFSREGLSVKRIYDDGSQKECTDYVLYHPNGNILHDGDIFTEEDASAGAISIRVSYSEDGETFETSFWINLTYTIPEPEPVEYFGYFWISSLPKTIYIAGDSLDLSGIKLDYYDQNNEWQEFTEEYTAEFYDLDTDISTPIPEKLSEGSFEVRITAKDGAITSSNTFSITVITVKNISTFKYSNKKKSVTIDGFVGKEPLEIDYDAPYDSVNSVSSDFEYDFLEGSQNDIIIIGIKEERFPIVTEVTIPATLDGYNVKQLAWDMFVPIWDEKSDEIIHSPVRTLIIEEGVECFRIHDERGKGYTANTIMGTLLPYLKKLILPKGFTLENKDPYSNSVYSVYYPTYSIQSKSLEELSLPPDLDVYDLIIKADRLKEVTIPTDNAYFTETSSPSLRIEGKSIEKITFLGKFLYKDVGLIGDCPNLKEVSISCCIYPENYQYTNLKKLTLTGNSFSKIHDPGIAKHHQYFSELEELIIDSDDEDVILPPFNYFSNCKKLKKITIRMKKDAVLYISSEQFLNCSSLEQIEFIGDEHPVTYIGDSAFSNTKISKFNLNADLAIGADAFSGTQIESFTFKENKSYYIYSDAFYGCPLKELVFEEGCVVTGDSSSGGESCFSDSCTFKSIDMSKAAYVDISFKGLKTLEEVNIGKCFFEGNFENCINLKEIQTDADTVFLPYSLNNTAITEITIQSKFYSEQSFFSEGNLNGKILKAEVWHPSDSKIAYTSASFSVYNTIRRLHDPNGSLKDNNYFIISYAEPNSDNIPYNYGKGMFENCPNLTKVTFKNTIVPSYIFGKVPNGSEKDVQILFEGNVSISDHAFYNCKKLKQIEFQAEVLDIDDYAFSGCENLKQLDLKMEAFLNINAYAFSRCINLKEVYLKALNFPLDYSTDTSTGAFSDCKNLEYVVIDAGEDNYISLHNTLFANCENLVSVEITKPIAQINTKCFLNCKNLTSLNLSSYIDDEKIGASAFKGCEKIVTLFTKNGLINDESCITLRGTGYVQENYTCNTILPDFSDVGVHNLTLSRKTYPYVPVGFAEGNTYLQTVTLDSDIEARAFKDCTSLTTVKLGDTTFHVARDDSFEGCTSLTKIIVPASYLEQYKSSPRWSKYKSLLCTE